MRKYFKNKRFFKTALTGVILISLVCFIVTCSLKKDSVKTKKWTFLFYDDADFNRAYNPLESFAEAAYSGDNTYVLVLQDKEHDPATIFYINENHQSIPRKDMGEINMADPAVLRDFLEYAKARYPAERYIISFYDHGAAWQGACVDDTTGNDILTMDEMQEALKNAGGVDIVCFSAPCLMGALESVYELRDCTKVYIGSENVSGYCWWHDTIRDICDTLNQSPGISNIQLGEMIVQSIERNSTNRPQYSEYIPSMTMSAVRTDKIVDVVHAVDALSIDFIDQLNESAALVNLVYDDVKFFSSGVDVYDLAEKCHSRTSDATFRSRLEDLMEALSSAVIAECHGSDMENAHGLSIYFPDPSSTYGYSTYYGSPLYGLDFSADTHWDEFLEAYLNTSGQTAVQQAVEPLTLETDGLYPPQKLK